MPAINKERKERNVEISRWRKLTEACSAALRKFGNVLRAGEETQEVWRPIWLEQFVQDARGAFRLLCQSPGFAAVVVLTLALGIGANTAIFSVVQGVVLAPLPYPDADRLVVVWQSNPHAPHASLSLPDFQEWRRNARSFQGMAGVRWVNFSLTSPGAPEHLTGYEISSGFFHTLGVQLGMGREFSAQE